MLVKLVGLVILYLHMIFKFNLIMKEWKQNHEDGHATQALYEWCETANMEKDKGQTKEVANC